MGYRNPNWAVERKSVFPVVIPLPSQWEKHSPGAKHASGNSLEPLPRAPADSPPPFALKARYSPASPLPFQLLVWNHSSLSPVQQYTEHLAAVKAIAWSPHQHGLLASGGGTADRCIRFWNTLTGQPLQCIDTGSQVCNLAWSKHANELVRTSGRYGNGKVTYLPRLRNSRRIPSLAAGWLVCFSRGQCDTGNIMLNLEALRHNSLQVGFYVCEYLTM